MSRDCRTCQYNTYQGADVTDWVSCCHPITISKLPQPEPGDPAFVNLRTGDLHISSIGSIGDCPAWEPADSKPAVNSEE